MLIEKHKPVNLFDLVPLERDKVLDELDQLLVVDAVFQDVESDLAQRRKVTRGRKLRIEGTVVERSTTP